VGESGGGVVIPAGDDAALVTVIDQARRGVLDTETYRQKARQFAKRVFDRDTVYGGVLASLLTPAVRADVEASSVHSRILSAEPVIGKGVER
jgi:hypothetical protein